MWSEISQSKGTRTGEADPQEKGRPKEKLAIWRELQYILEKDQLDNETSCVLI